MNPASHMFPCACHNFIHIYGHLWKRLSCKYHLHGLHHGSGRRRASYLPQPHSREMTVKRRRLWLGINCLVNPIRRSVCCHVPASLSSISGARVCSLGKAYYYLRLCSFTPPPVTLWYFQLNACHGQQKTYSSAIASCHRNSDTSFVCSQTRLKPRDERPFPWQLTYAFSRPQSAPVANN